MALWQTELPGFESDHAQLQFREQVCIHPVGYRQIAAVHRALAHHLHDTFRFHTSVLRVHYGYGLLEFF